MKPRLILLYTCDRNFERVLGEAVFGIGAVILIARNIGDALQIVSRRRRELHLAVLDFTTDCRGMALLSAIQTCCEEVPTLVVAPKDSEHANAIADAHGARICLNKPLSAAMLANAIADLTIERTVGQSVA